MSNGKNYLLWSGVIVGSAQNIFKSIFCSLISIVIDNTNQLIFLFSPQRGLAVPPPQRRQRRVRRLRGRVRGHSGQEYFLSDFFLMNIFSQDIRVDWAPERVVYKHTEKDRWGWGMFNAYSGKKFAIFCCRYIFWNAGGLGWSIGKLEYLEDGRHWHKSRFIFRKVPPWTIIRLFSGGSDAKEPWQDVWLSGVTVKCSSNRQQKSKSGQMPN